MGKQKTVPEDKTTVSTPTKGTSSAISFNLLSKHADLFRTKLVANLKPALHYNATATYVFMQLLILVLKNKALPHVSTGSFE